MVQIARSSLSAPLHLIIPIYPPHSIKQNCYFRKLEALLHQNCFSFCHAYLHTNVLTILRCIPDSVSNAVLSVCSLEKRLIEPLSVKPDVLVSQLHAAIATHSLLRRLHCSVLLLQPQHHPLSNQNTYLSLSSPTCNITHL